MTLNYGSANFKKAAVAAVATSALVLTACGSEDTNADGGADTTTTSTSTSTVATSSAKPSTSAKATTSKKAEKKEEEKKEEDNKDAQAAAPADNPQGEEVVEEVTIDDVDPEAQALAEQLPIENVVHEPVEGGEPASEEDYNAISDLVHGVNRETTVRGALSYIPNHTCNAVIDEVGGREALDFAQIPDVPLSQWPGYEDSKANIEAIEDVIVNGNEASASVTTSNAQERQTETMRFLWEDDQWKFCR